ncbi:MAG: tRNA (adenosine(37)-N6)-threonylcarbamoyltransferase complex ATPase subunit type 1 TsaE [Planctomycetes bacterium]|nr:tRNA (adenosine(37)-N6)-threonylcarbamoyltransferase complex ATPase subunit type 1 TsaE [Planctomycetota bacterium]
MAAELLWRARSHASETTEALGVVLGRVLVPGALLALVGELGAGKTTLVRGLGRGLELDQAVASPTFTRMRALSGRLALYHFDAWRGGAEALFAEGTEFLAGEGVAVVEWADRVEAYLPAPRAELTFAHRGVSVRELEARLLAPQSGAGARERELHAALARALRLAGSCAGLELLEAR